MALKIYNTLTQKKESFFPQREGKVGMYVCGVTVYDLCHIGHARAFVVFDVIYRYLAKKGYQVTYVRNFTDVDDKIIARAYREGVPYEEIIERYIDRFRQEMARLRVKTPQVEPRVTEHIPDILRLIEGLMAKGYAYPVDGDVFYAVDRFPSYGKLSGKDVQELQAGARIEVNERKVNPLDFALWKASKPGEPAWDSPWGKGRPGWHIECSAMSMKYLGETFDIHGGGQDLIFPHHENEIAQSEAYSGQAFARYWVHNGFININQEKMSKSSGNFFTIAEILERYHPEVVRLFLLSRHYRSPIDFSPPLIEQSRKNLIDLYRLLSRMDGFLREGVGSEHSAMMEKMGEGERELYREVEGWRGKFETAMDNDFNTAQALGYLFQLGKQLHRFLEEGVPSGSKGAWGLVEKARREIMEAGEVLGLFGSPPEDYPLDEEEGLCFDLKALIIALEERKGMIYDHFSSPDKLEHLKKCAESRERARKSKDWSTADQIREDLEKEGILLEDTAQGTRFRLKG